MSPLDWHVAAQSAFLKISVTVPKSSHRDPSAPNIDARGSLKLSWGYYVYHFLSPSLLLWIANCVELETLCKREEAAQCVRVGLCVSPVRTLLQHFPPDITHSLSLWPSLYNPFVPPSYHKQESLWCHSTLCVNMDVTTEDCVAIPVLDILNLICMLVLLLLKLLYYYFNLFYFIYLYISGCKLDNGC